MAEGEIARTDEAAGSVDERPVRPTGTWVVAGFLVFAITVIWWLTAAVFQARS